MLQTSLKLVPPVLHLRGTNHFCLSTEEPENLVEEFFFLGTDTRSNYGELNRLDLQCH
jgi:hypothetical protein